MILRLRSTLGADFRYNQKENEKIKKSILKKLSEDVVFFDIFALFFGILKEAAFLFSFKKILYRMHGAHAVRTVEVCADAGGEVRGQHRAAHHDLHVGGVFL